MLNSVFRFVAAAVICTLGIARSAVAAPLAYSVRADESSAVYTIDLANGNATLVGAPGFNRIRALTFDAAGATLYGYDEDTNQLVTVNTTTGVATAVGPSGQNLSGVGLTADCDGGLWLSESIVEVNPARIYRVDTTTGAATVVGDIGNGGATGLATHPATLALFGISNGEGASLLSINRATGASTEIGQLNNVQMPGGGIDFDVDGTLWGINSGEFEGSVEGFRSQIFTINTTTGTATKVTFVQIPVTQFYSLAIPGGLDCPAPPPVNTIPSCNAGGPYSAASCTDKAAQVSVLGIQSQDADGDPLTYSWTTSCPGAAFNNASSVAPVLTLPSAQNAGECGVSLTVNDGTESNVCAASIVLQGCPCVIEDLSPKVDGIINETVDIVRMFRRSAYIRYLINKRGKINPLTRELVKTKLQTMLTKLRDVAKDSLSRTNYTQCGVSIQCEQSSFAQQKAGMNTVVDDFFQLIAELNGTIPTDLGKSYRREQKRLATRTNARLTNLRSRIGEYPDTVQSGCEQKVATRG